MAISRAYIENLRKLPLNLLNTTWENLTEMLTRYPDDEVYRAQGQPIIDAYMSEIMDRAYADHKRWTVLRSAFPTVAEPAAGTAKYDHVAFTYRADCLHCGEDIMQTVVNHKLVWVHSDRKTMMNNPVSCVD